MRTALAGFSTMSEFTNLLGLHGDCGPTATLAALHVHNPDKWPQTPAALKALDQEEIAHGFEEANGAQNIPSLDKYLSSINVAHTTYGYGTSLDAIHALFKQLAGKKPFIVEWANAGALPGDEPGVKFHFSTCGGIDTGPKGDGVGGGYLFADGDNRGNDSTGLPRPPFLYPWAEPQRHDIVTAQPIAVVVIEPYPQPAPTPAPPPVTPAPPAQKLVTITLTADQIAAVKAA